MTVAIIVASAAGTIAAGYFGFRLALARIRVRHQPGRK